MTSHIPIGDFFEDYAKLVTNILRIFKKRRPLYGLLGFPFLLQNGVYPCVFVNGLPVLVLDERDEFPVLALFAHPEFFA